MVGALILAILAVDPRAEVEAMRAEVQQVLGAPAATVATLESAVIRHFDVDELVARACGPHWTKLSRSQRRALVGATRDLLRATYARRALGIREASAEIGAPKVEGGEAEVPARILSGRRQIPVLVRLHLVKLKGRPERWRVYDVVAGGTSVVDLYTRAFRQPLEEEGPAALIKKVREKAIELERGPQLLP